MLNDALAASVSSNASGHLPLARIFDRRQGDLHLSSTDYRNMTAASFKTQRGALSGLRGLIILAEGR